MKNKFFLFCFLLQVLVFKAQKACETGFVPDTLYLPAEAKTVSGQYLQATLKNKSVVRLYKTAANRYYMKLIVTENLYFDKTDKLEVQSGTMSFYETVRQYELDKATGYYVFEIFKNYIATLKDEGITGIIFGKAETNYTRQDASQVKQIAKCFYENIATKK